MASRVVLHVGTPKSGTTYLQDIAWGNRDRLERAGVVLPLRDRYALDQAAGDLLGITRRVARGEEQVTWDRLVAEVRALEGTVLITTEALASARPAHLARLAADLDLDRLDIVVTARDPARQLVSVWQQELKHGRTLGLQRFLDLVAGGQHQRWNLQQDLPSLVGRWTGIVPAARVHVVIVPASGTPSDELWNRFAGVLGIDPAGFDLPEGAVNVTLDAPGAEALRRLNSALGGRLAFPVEYVPTVRHLAVPALSAEPGAPMRLPVDSAAWVEELGRSYADGIGASGARVVGDLRDLAGTMSAEPAGGQKPVVSEAEVSRRLAAAAAELAVAHAGARTRAAELRERLAAESPPRRAGRRRWSRPR